MAQVAACLKVPLAICLTLAKNQREAAALLETTFRGQQLQELLQLQSAQQSCDVSHLQKLCTSLLSSGDAALAAPVPAVMQTAAAITRASDAVQLKVAECLQAVSALSAELRQHSETNHTIAVELGKQASCQELALERRLLSRLQLELGERAGHVARVRGHCSLPPFSEAVEALKAEAAASFASLAQQQQQQQQQQQHAGQVALLHQAPLAPSHAHPRSALQSDVQALAQGLQAVAAQVQQLVHAQQTQQAVPQLQWAGAEVAPPAGPQVHDLSPGGTLQQPPLRPAPQRQSDQRQTNTLQQQQQQQQQQSVIVSAARAEVPAPAQPCKSGRDRALRGDAAPSTSTDGDASLPASQGGAIGNDGGNAQQQQRPPSQGFEFAAPPAPAALEPGGGPAGVPLHSATPSLPKGSADSGGSAGDEPEGCSGKENHDASQSQPAAGGGSQQELLLTQPMAAAEAEGASAEERLRPPAAQDAEAARHEGHEGGSHPPGGFPPAVQPPPPQEQRQQLDEGQAQPKDAVLPAAAAAPAILLNSQRDSTATPAASRKPGSATDPDSSGGKTKTSGGSGSGSGCALPAPHAQQEPRAAANTPAEAVRGAMMPPPPQSVMAGKRGAVQEAGGQAGKRPRYVADAERSSAEEPHFEEPLPGQPTPGWHRQAAGAAGPYLYTQPGDSEEARRAWESPAPVAAAQRDPGTAALPSLSVWDTPAPPPLPPGAPPDDPAPPLSADPPAPFVPQRAWAGAQKGATPNFLPTGYAGDLPLLANARFTPGTDFSRRHQHQQLGGTQPPCSQQQQPHRLARGASAAPGVAPEETPCRGSNQLRRDGS